MIILCGPSASGKTETALNLARKYPFRKVITTTTRSLRYGEKNDVDYHFVTLEHFNELIKNDMLVEHTFYNGNYYGCTKDEVGDNKVACLDPNGVKSFKNLNDSRIITFFLKCDEKIRKDRMIFRKDDSQKIEQRLQIDRIDFSEDKMLLADFVVDTTNLSIDEVTDKIYNLYKEKLTLIK